jgi:hypothetical protein
MMMMMVQKSIAMCQFLRAAELRISPHDRNSIADKEKAREINEVAQPNENNVGLAAQELR